MSEAPETTVGGDYLHWDKFRHRTPPEGLSLNEWWLGVRMRRDVASRPVPLVDNGRSPFRFNLADPIPQGLNRIDLMAGGTIGAPAQVTNKESRNQYVIKSLIEEAITSSQLEGAPTTRKVAREMIRQKRDPRDEGERMILNNYRAMERIVELKGEDLTPGLVFEVQRIVTEGTLRDPGWAGRLRRADEYRVVGDDFGEVLHEPPTDDELPARLAAMCDFANGRTPAGFVHPVVRAMILHFWLAYDHPFVDGNGRTARALFYWSMLRREYWLFEYISISRIILDDPSKYGMAFLYTETDANDLTYFLIYHLGVILRAVDVLHEYIGRRSREVGAATADLRGMTALNHRQREIVGHALRHPGTIYTVESHRSSHGVVYETARSDLIDLVDRRLLTKSKAGNAWNFAAAEGMDERLRRPPDG